MRSPSTPVAAQAHRSIHWLSLLQFSGSALGILIAWSIAFGAGFYGLFQLLGEHSGSPSITATFLTALSAFFGGAVLLPSAALSLARLINRPYQARYPLARWVKVAPAFALLFLPIAVYMGNLAAQSEKLAWLLLPPVHVLSAAFLCTGLLWLALRKLQTGSLQRLLASFATGLTLSPMLAFFFEAITIAGFVLVGFLYLNSQPELLTELEKLIEPANSRLFNSGQSMRTLSLLLEDPFIVALLVAYLSLAVPLIEELLKPLGVWLLLGRPLTGSQGFALGILGGAGFGLFENLTLGATPVDWTLTNTLRIGATALHMATGGLVGWAIVRAKNERRYLQFLATYGASVFLHGLWNAMAIVYTRNSLAKFTESATLHLDSPPILVLSLLSVVCFALLIINNRDLRREQNQPSAE